jgi:HEAT repeat protein
MDAVRDLCIRLVREQNLREHLPRVRELLRSPNDDVKRQAMVTVGEWGDEESRPALEEAAKSHKPLVKSAATAALRRLDAARARP